MKANTSRRVAVLLTLLVLGGAACAVRKGTDPGGAFRTADNHLYFNGGDLGEVGYVSIAPSGRWAVFTRKNEIFLIAAEGGALAPIGDGEFAMPEQVHWNEAEGYAEIEYAGGRPATRVELKAGSAAGGHGG